QKSVVIAYVSAYGYTKAMAEQIADGIESAGAQAKLYDLPLRRPSLPRPLTPVTPPASSPSAPSAAACLIPSSRTTETGPESKESSGQRSSRGPAGK
ncbi:MAG: hypothetical protein IIY74_00665, partial [Firmicutes bacterium]|nr:hypothetical protein [Bacillota bacterium]